MEKAKPWVTMILSVLIGIGGTLGFVDTSQVGKPCPPSEKVSE